jgi:peptide/nickel transport system substrate-binding protein
MEIIKKTANNGVGPEHPYIPELKDLYLQKRITRRDFLRHATLLGMSFAGASAFLASCGQPTPVPTAAPTAVPTAAPTATAVPTVKRGGTLRVDWAWLSYVDDPSKDGVGVGEAGRCVAETLTRIDETGAVHPLLAQRWEANEDVSVWTFYLQQGVKFNNGKDFGANDVVWNLQHWLDPVTGSAMKDALAFLSPTGIEKVDDHTMRLHLDRPSFAVPFIFFNYPALILPEGGCKDFYKGDAASAIGTGPYVMKAFTPEESIEFTARQGYWQKGEDGQPLPYLDGIRFVAGLDDAAKLAAITGGEIDIVHKPSDASMDTLAKNPDVVTERKPAEDFSVIRVRCDLDPFTDVRVRQAFKLCQDRERIRELAFQGHGTTGYDHLVPPMEEGYYPLENRPQDIAKAKALLAEAGFANGLDVQLQYDSGYSPDKDVAPILQQQLALAGIRVTLAPMPSGAFWDQWDKWPFSIDAWTGRGQLQNLSTGCRCGGVWNEMHWCNKDFDATLDQIEATLDIDKRRTLMQKLEQIMQDDSGLLLPFWKDTKGAYRKNVRNYTKHIFPNYYLLNVWLA